MKISPGIYEKEFILTDLAQTWGSIRKVGVLRRKARRKTYESPRIVLDSEFKDLIGKRFATYRGRAIVIKNLNGKKREVQGSCLIFFFEDSKEDSKG